MKNMSQFPLVSLCITTYNQQQYVRESVKSAFAQTYSPLEIVIADDCSTDATGDIIQHMVDSYIVTGKHAVKFIRNDINIGLARNYEQAFRMASGDLLVTGAGDDISFPDRISEIVRRWQADGSSATAFSHAAETIDKNGVPGGLMAAPSFERPVGAMMGYSKRVVSEFTSLNNGEVFEDDVFSHRAMILGRGLIINKPLMYYRVGSGESTKGAPHARRKRVSRICINSIGQTWGDLKAKRTSLKASKYDELRKKFRFYDFFYRSEYRMYSGNFKHRIRWYFFHNKIKTSDASFYHFLLWIIPDALFLPFRSAKRIVVKQSSAIGKFFRFGALRLKRKIRNGRE